jgi:hypothetical protein
VSLENNLAMILLLFGEVGWAIVSPVLGGDVGWGGWKVGCSLLSGGEVRAVW